MFSRKICFYAVIVLTFLATSLPIRCLWAEESPKMKVSDQPKAEGQKENLPAENQPRIAIIDPVYDAGEVWEGDKVSHTFIVKNTGTAQLDISKVKPG